jgi:hypothetical protein
MITEGHLTWPAIQELSAALHESDALEVSIGGEPARFALAYGLMFGFSRAAYRDDRCIGAWGYTPAGVIWSLWAPLSRKESAMVKHSTLPRLHNYVHAKNSRALKWLERSGCFSIDTCNPRLIGKGEEFYYFETMERP